MNIPIFITFHKVLIQLLEFVATHAHHIFYHTAASLPVDARSASQLLSHLANSDSVPVIQSSSLLSTLFLLALWLLLLFAEWCFLFVIVVANIVITLFALHFSNFVRCLPYKHSTVYLTIHQPTSPSHTDNALSVNAVEGDDAFMSLKHGFRPQDIHQG